LELH
jgi:hypothetical protein